jgi:RNA polymerase primary sigma factor
VPELLEIEDDAPAARLVVLAQDWIKDGCLSMSDLHRLVDEVDLPAREYRIVVDLFSDAGIKVVEDDDDFDDSDGEPGPAVDGFSYFMQRARHSLLTAEEEKELGIRMETGSLAKKALHEHPDLDEATLRRLNRLSREGKKAERELIEHNYLLVVSIAHKRKRFCSASIEFEDLVQEGYWGLARAAQKYDYRKGWKFSTYATWWIRQAIDRAIMDKGLTIRIPVHAREALISLARAENALRNDGIEATPQRLATVTGYSVVRVRGMLGWRRPIESLDALWKSGRDIDRGGLDDPEWEVVRSDMTNAIDRAVSHLSPRETEVVERRFGLRGRRSETLEEIGTSLGVTRERVRQIEQNALKELRGLAPEFSLVGMLEYF